MLKNYEECEKDTQCLIYLVLWSFYDLDYEQSLFRLVRSA